MLARRSFAGFFRAGLALAVSVALSLACSGKSDDGDGDEEADCVTSCEKAQSCPDAEPGVDCEASCREAEEVVDSAGCRAEFESYFSCIAALSDICSLPLGECDDQSTVLGMCLSA